MQLYHQGQRAKALEFAEKHLETDPDDATALTLMVQIHSDMGRTEAAAEAAETLAVAMPEDFAKILVRAHYWYIEAKRFADAERLLRQVTRKDPTFVEAQRLLAGLLCAQGRRRESVEPLKQLIRLKAAQPDELLALLDVGTPRQLVSYKPYYKPGDGSLFHLGDALDAYVLNHQNDQAQQRLQNVLESHPNCVPARVLKGRLLIESGRQEDFEKWIVQCDPKVSEHPGYWSALALSKQLRGELTEAVMAYAVAIELEPTDRNSLRGLAECLEANDEQAKANRVRERLVMLEKIFRVAASADAETAREIADLLQKLSRPLESTGWLMRSMELQGALNSQQAAFDKRIAKIVAWEATSPPEARQRRWLESVVGIKPDRSRVARSASERNGTKPLSNPDSGKNASIRLVERSTELGLPMDAQTILNEDQIHVPFLYQTTGSGVAVLDFDLDGRPDLYEVRCTTQPLKEEAQAANRLYRQNAKNCFEDMTSLAGVGDRGFGQGVAAGDLNQDGFTDLVVANFGKNHIYLNQGDGTFRLVEDSPFQTDSWTTSIAIADLSGDHLPEMVAINYIDDPAAPTRPCPLGTNCTPQQMLAAEDHFYLCNDDGTYSKIDKLAGLDTANYGLGMVVADFTGDGTNEVFVGNDAEHNQFWKWDRKNGVLAESALARGCAVGRNGLSQACMGVAAGDYNGDGRLDLHVTNFLDEPANLFVQTSAGMFADETLRYGLFESSNAMLGFGTQAGDFDNDGWLDLVRLNGHVYGDPKNNLPFRMPPQVMAGTAGRFSLLAPKDVTYFTEPALGRSLAMLDVTGDGDLDLVATHLDRPMAILENETSRPGNWIQFELVGTVSERDAVGARLTVTTSDRFHHAWRTAGSGYLCSNEPLLHLGMGDEKVQDVTIRWPSGLAQRLGSLKANHRYRVIESHPAERIK